MADQFLILDISSAPIADAAAYLEPVSAPANYRDQAKIDAYVAEKTAERVAMLATDIDLAQVTGVGCWNPLDDEPDIKVWNAWTERELIEMSADYTCRARRIVTYGGHNFDLPLLMRRARYLGIDFPKLNLDRYRSPHIDLCELLSDREWKRRRSLSFYVRRLGWTDLDKPLSGEQESRVLETGQWAELEQSLRHDVTAIYRLSQWLQVWTPAADTSQEVVL